MIGLLVIGIGVILKAISAIYGIIMDDKAQRDAIENGLVSKYGTYFDYHGKERNVITNKRKHTYTDHNGDKVQMDIETKQITNFSQIEREKERYKDDGRTIYPIENSSVNHYKECFSLYGSRFADKKTGEIITIVNWNSEDIYVNSFTGKFIRLSDSSQKIYDMCIEKNLTKSIKKYEEYIEECKNKDFSKNNHGCISFYV